jgi:hypothetical protein
MLSSKTGLSLNMAGHYPGGHKKKSASAVTHSERSLVYPDARYLGVAYPDRSGRRAER